MVENPSTIAAIATAPGRSGVGIVRVSGPLSEKISQTITGVVPPPRTAYYAHFVDPHGELIDRGLIFLYPAPNSYTGEDVLELHGHGSPYALSEMLDACLVAGAIMARPGEFTERAFLNGKLDLAQAESVIDLIDARSKAAARAAVRSLDGVFSQIAEKLVEQLISVRVYVEAALDFSEEEVDFLSDNELQQRVDSLRGTLRSTIVAAQQGRLLQEGISIVISGAPNVGKSSLLNQLAGHDAAIITDIAGTTRDILREHIQIDGLPVTVIDTAGLRESDDPIEREGIRRAQREIEKADRVFYVREMNGNKELPPAVIAGKSFDTIVNKIDLSNAEPRVDRSGTGTTIFLSAKTGDGIDLLKQHIKKSVGYATAGESNFIARKRHVDALHQASEHIENGLRNLSERSFPEIAAEDFSLAQKSLQEITGEFTSDDLLGQIFSNFCIGK